jgi:hypothetical protein
METSIQNRLPVDVKQNGPFDCPTFTVRQLTVEHRMRLVTLKNTVKWLIVHTFGELAIAKVTVSWALLRTIFRNMIH